MAAKKIDSNKGKAQKKRLVLFHGIKIDVATGARSNLSKIVQRELQQRAESRDKRKKA